MSHLVMFLACLGGFVALACGMVRPQEAVFGRVFAPRITRGLRGMGWALLAVSLWVAVQGPTTSLALVAWFGHLSFAAAWVFLALVCHDRWRARG
jgi:hypothetical protein